MTITILEDEPLAAQHLRDLLAELLPDATLHGPLPSVKTALAYFEANPTPDLIFSDIELLDGNVFALFERITVRCPVVFTTAYDQFLLKAFQGNGIAYLLKPFNQAQVSQALMKFDGLKTQLAGAVLPAPAGLSAEVVQQLREALQPAQATYRQRFTAKLRQGIVLLDVTDIVCLQSDERVVFAFDTAGRKYPLNGTLTELETQLNPAHFFRLNRSEIIHVRHVERIETYSGDRLAVRMWGQDRAFVSSTTRTAALRNWLDG